MRHSIRAATLLLVAAAGLAACFGGSDADGTEVGETQDAPAEARPAESRADAPGPDESMRSLQDMARRAESAISEIREKAAEPIPEPIDFRQLRDLLPEELAGLPRTDMKGEKRQMLGTLGISQASATYRDADEDSPANLTVEIQDLGGMSSLSALGVTWFLTSIDAETSTGFRRTREFDGHRAYQEFESSNGNGRGRIEVFVADRFLVKVQGVSVEVDVLERAIREIDLDALERMRNAGREAS